jgi:hypothetical protein
MSAAANQHIDFASATMLADAIEAHGFAGEIAAMLRIGKNGDSDGGD